MELAVATMLSLLTVGFSGTATDGRGKYNNYSVANFLPSVTSTSAGELVGLFGVTDTMVIL